MQREDLTNRDIEFLARLRSADLIELLDIEQEAQFCGDPQWKQVAIQRAIRRLTKSSD